MMATETLKMAVLSSQTVHACFAVAFRAQSSTRFVTGETSKLTLREK